MILWKTITALTANQNPSVTEPTSTPTHLCAPLSFCNDMWIFQRFNATAFCLFIQPQENHLFCFNRHLNQFKSILFCDKDARAACLCARRRVHTHTPERERKRETLTVPWEHMTYAVQTEICRHRPEEREKTEEEREEKKEKKEEERQSRKSVKE